MTHDRLGGEDAAWLHMDKAANPMVVNGVLELAETLPLARAGALFTRLAASARFRARVVEPSLGLGWPSWEPDPSFELAAHVQHVALERGDEATLRAFIGRAVSAPLDRRRALWHAFVIDRPGAGTTILYRVHHSIADGFALLGVFLSLCDDGATVVPARRPAAPRRARPAFVVGAAQALRRLVTLPADPATLLKGRVGLEKRVAWSEPFALTDVKAAARFAGATVNDVLVATAAGALGRYLAGRGAPTSDLEIRAMVPVDLRDGATPHATLGNRFGLVFLGLPLGISDPLARIAAVKERMDRLKATPEAPLTYALLSAMGVAPRRLEERAVAFFAKKASLVLTNVPGPRARLTMAGIAVKRIMFWVPQSGGMGLGISIFSYAGEVTIGILADAAVVPDPEVLVMALHAEYAALATRRGATPSPVETAASVTSRR